MPILEAPIVAVTVFVNRARVTRLGKIALETGEHVLILDTVSQALESDSVRASGRGQGVTLLGVDVKTEYVTDAPQQSIANLESQLNELQNTLQALNDEAWTLVAQLSLIESFSKTSSRKLGQSPDSSLKTVTELSAYVAEQMNTLHAAQRHNAQQRSDLKKRIETVQAQLQDISTPLQHQKRQIHVAVRADEATDFELEVAYAVSGAMWQPFYDVRLRADGEVELTYLANVTQRTGEDWTDVEMSLSTARPALTTQLPDLDPWYLWVHDHREGMKRMAMYRATPDEVRRMEMREAAAPAPRPAEPPKPQASIAQSSIVESSSGASVTYKVGTPVTVPADGSPHKTTVAITRLSAKLDYITAPKTALEAYLRATITNTSAYTLLPGEVSIFHGDEFVGKTRLALTAPTEEFQVQLGLDNRIKIERELTNREASKRFIGLSRRLSYVYRITVTNLLPTSTKITVLDQYPIPRDENIKIQHDNTQPEPTESTELGVLTWAFELAPNAKQIIVLAFTVEYARDATVRGLPE